MLTKWGQKKKSLRHRGARLFAAMMVMVLAVGLMPAHKADAASPVPGFNVKDDKNEYTYSSVYKRKTVVHDSLAYYDTSAGYNQVKYETPALGNSEGRMYIATSKSTYSGGSRYKVVMIRQIVNPYPVHSYQYSVDYNARVKLAKLHFPFLSGHDEMDSFPHAVSPTGSASTSWSIGGSVNSSFCVTASASLGRQESYGKNAVTIKNTKGSDKVRKISYEVSSNSSVGSGFQEAVNQFSENSLTAEYEVSYLYRGNNTSDVNKRITLEVAFVSVLSCQTRSAVGQFTASMY